MSSEPQNELFALAERIQQEVGAFTEDDPTALGLLSRLERAAEEIGKAWSGSRLGEHEWVYYGEFIPPPTGASFDRALGLNREELLRRDQELRSEARPLRKIIAERKIIFNQRCWRAYSWDDIVEEIERRACRSKDVTAAQNLLRLSTRLRKLFVEIQAEMLAILTFVLERRGDDPFIVSIRDDIAEMVPGEGGLEEEAAPHLKILKGLELFRARVRDFESVRVSARRAGTYIAREKSALKEAPRAAGDRIFIGHGRSAAWQEVKAFLEDRLGLPIDEFNRVPVAGISTNERLSEMLDSSAMAFLIFTAEDNHADGRTHARLNVVHEAGLFQGRHGFRRAIVVLEEGCGKFSNLDGLTHIEFPKGRISAAFEEIRRVLEREKLLPAAARTAKRPVRAPAKKAVAPR